MPATHIERLQLLAVLPRARPAVHPGKANLQYRDVTLTTADGVKLHAWWLPAKAGVPLKGTVLHLHGNGGNLAWHLGGSWWLPEQGYQVLLLDYRGYGLSEGKPSLPAIYQDIDAAFGWIDKAPETQGQPLIIPAKPGRCTGGALPGRPPGASNPTQSAGTGRRASQLS